MGDPAPASTTPDLINALADEVQQHGQSTDTLVADLAKGNREAIDGLKTMGLQLLSLFKGSNDDDEDDDDEDEDDDTDHGEDDDDDGDDDDGPGYRMNKGTSSASLFDEDDASEPVDASAFLADMAKSQGLILEELRNLRLEREYQEAENEELREQVALLQKSQVHLGKMLEHLGGVVGETTTEMAKAVQGIQSGIVEAKTKAEAAQGQAASLTKAVSQIPAAPKTPYFQPRLAQPPGAELGAVVKPPTGFLGNLPSKKAETQLLMKAVNAEIIYEEQENHYKTQGVFSPNPEEHAAIERRVLHFASTLNPKVTA